MLWESGAFRRVRADPSYRRRAVYLIGLLLALGANRLIVATVPEPEQLEGLARTAFLALELLDIAAMAYFAAFGGGWLLYRSMAPGGTFALGLVAAGVGLIAVPIAVVAAKGRGEAGAAIAVIAALLWYFAMPAAIQDTRTVTRGWPRLARAFVIAVAVIVAIAFPIVAWQALAT